MPTVDEMRAALKQDSVSQPSIEEMRAALKTEPQQSLPQVTTGVSAFGGKMSMPGQKVSEKDMDTLKNSLINNAPMIGGTLGEILPIPGGMYAGAALGSAVKQYNQPNPSFKEGVIDTALNSAIPHAVGTMLAPPIRYAGNQIYKSAFKIPDQVAVENGAVPLSNYFMKDKPVLTMGDMALENAKLGKSGMEGMRSSIDEATHGYPSTEGAPQVAPPIDQEAGLGKALDKAQELKNNPFTASAGKTLEQQVLDYWGKGNDIPLSEAYKMSKDTGKMANWAGRAADMPKSEVLQQARHGLEGEVENSLSQFDPQLADKYMNAKQATRTSILSEPFLKREVGKTIRKNVLTETKAGLGGLGLQHQIERQSQTPEGIFPLALMYAAKLYNTPLGRTAVGKTVSGAAENLPLLLRPEMNKLSPWLEPQGEQK